MAKDDRKLRGPAWRGSSLAQAIQGNFDHLMGVLRNLTKSHNLLVGDVENIAEDTGTHTAEIGDHETRIIVVEEEIVDLGSDAETNKALNARKPQGGPWYHEHDDIIPMFVPPAPAEDPVPQTYLHDDLIDVTSDQHHDAEHQHSSPSDGGRYVYAGEVEADEALYVFGGIQLASVPDTITLTADEDDLVVADDTHKVRFFTNTGDHHVTGISSAVREGAGFSSSEGVLLILRNSSSSTADVILDHNSLASLSPFFFADAADVTLVPGESLAVVYNGDDGAWEKFTMSGSGGGAGTPGTDGVDGQTIPGMVPSELLDFDPDMLRFVPPPAVNEVSTTTKTWYVSPSEGEIDDAALANVGATPDLVPIWNFPEGSNRSGIYFGTVIPLDWNSGTVEVFIWWATSTSSGNVRWLTSVSELAVGDAGSEVSDKLAASITDVADSTTLKRTSLGTFTPTTAGDPLKVNIERHANAAADTATGAGRIYQVEFRYTATTPAGPRGATGPAGAGTDTDTDVWDYQLPVNFIDGVQAYKRLITRTCTITAVQAYSELTRSSAVTVDVQKNGVTVYSVTTKPDIPAAGGAGTARVPDTTAWAAGDILSIVLSSSNGIGPASVFLKVVTA